MMSRSTEERQSRNVTPMGEFGFFGYFNDGEGNLMGLFENPPGA